MTTLHGLSGRAMGEIAGMAPGSALGRSNGTTIAVAAVLAFRSGDAMTMCPPLRSGQAFGAASRMARAADSAAIALVEVTDSAAMPVIPGAMDAPLDSATFRGRLAPSHVGAHGHGDDRPACPIVAPRRTNRSHADRARPSMPGKVRNRDRARRRCRTGA